MPKANKGSVCQQVLNLTVGETVQFPLARMKSIRTTITKMHKLMKNRYTIATTFSHINVTCTARPEPQTDKIINIK